MQKTTLIGNLGCDPEIQDANGTPVCSFPVATTERWKDHKGNKQERTEWHQIVAWGKLATICHKYLNTGSRVYLEGRNKTHRWTDKENVERYITQIHATEMEMLGGGNGNSEQEDPPEYPNDVPF